MIIKIEIEKVNDPEKEKEAFLSLINNFNEEAKKRKSKFKVVHREGQVFLEELRFFGAFANRQEEIFWFSGDDEQGEHFYFRDSLLAETFNQFKEIVEIIPERFNILLADR